jgi:hypothetical protein
MFWLSSIGDRSGKGNMGELINGEHPQLLTKAHWCEYHCSRRLESEGGMPSCDCDQFEDDEDDER